MKRKIITYNVNGIRAAIQKGWLDWLKASRADIVCLQEIKATPEQIDVTPFDEMGYDTYWFPAEKKGYSGTAILSRQKPDDIIYGCGIADYDREGRILRADYGDISVISAYFPSGSSGDERQDFKMKFLADFQQYVTELRKTRKKLIISGDYNICHKPIDIHNPVSNKNSSGFLPEERAWMDQFTEGGFVDTFRLFNQEPHQYTWWSFRANARAKNLGWRIDYQMVTKNLEKNCLKSVILPEAKHSDHCPVVLEMDW